MFRRLDEITQRVKFGFLPREFIPTQPKETQMAEQASLVQEGVDRINGALRSIDGEFQRVQQDLGDRRRSFEKQFTKSRKSMEKQSRKEVKRIRSRVSKSPLVKRAESLRKDVNKQLESGMDNILGLFQIASRSDMGRIDRRLNALVRRVKEIENGRKVNGSAASESS